jgi:nanoRNase/pAp phosphatase (c-di-AMP/oligoRNAs hydrolase)
MAYFRQLDEQVQQMLALLHKEERWLIVINADPDALGAALALKRILSRRVAEVAISQVNEIKRPDNLAMIRYLRIKTRRLIPNLAAQYDRFALLDSQPHHHPAFQEIPFAIVIDHHPLVEDKPVNAAFVDVRPKYGATCTMLTEYLYNLGIKPARLLATALLYGIKCDTQDYERGFIDADVSAFKYLAKTADRQLLTRITKSEFHLEWIRYFSRAFYNLQRVGQGLYAHMGKVENSDILVIVADFFTRVHGIAWNVISGECDGKLVIVFRGDGLRKDMGQFAKDLFGDAGSAGGHRRAARAEIEIKNVDALDAEAFVLNRLCKGKCALNKKT